MHYVALTKQSKLGGIITEFPGCTNKGFFYGMSPVGQVCTEGGEGVVCMYEIHHLGKKKVAKKMRLLCFKSASLCDYLFLHFVLILLL